MTATSNVRRTLRWVMGVALVLGGWACVQTSTGGGTSSAAGSGGSGQASTSGAGGASAGSGITVPDAGAGGNPCTTPAPSDGPDPPKTPCDPASDAGACDLPPSVCANTKWLVYYVNPQCIGGFCQWDKKTFNCPL